MQAFFGTRTAADINLVAQVFILAGLLVGFYLARQKRFAQHANVQTALVLVNVFLIASVMVPSLTNYVIASGTTTGRVAQLMMAHGALGLVVEIVALYLILRMRTTLIPKRFRLSNIKLAMRVTLALWFALVLLGFGIYAERYLFQQEVASAPLLEFRQLGADLYVHAVELDDANARNSLAATKRHAEHLINLIEGQKGLDYGDSDGDGRLEDPGDGIGLLARLDAVATAANDPVIVEQAHEIRQQLDQIVALSVDLMSAQQVAETTERATDILDLARSANTDGVFRIDFAAREAGVTQAPELAIAAATPGAAGTVMIHEDQFRYNPASLTVPIGTTVVWVNDERSEHTVTAEDNDFDSGDQQLGESFSYTFSEPGTFRYYCRFHGDVGGVGMSGTITVK
jgi:plastocyanin